MKQFCSGLMGIFLLFATEKVIAQNFWQQVGSPGPYSINTLYVDSSDVLLAGTSNGVYRSTNDGSTWQSIGLSNEYVLMLKRFNGNLFACTFASGLYRSTNNGTSWSLVGGGLPAGTVYSIAVQGQSLYAAFIAGIYKSTDNGATWTVTGMTNPNQTIVVATPAGHLYAADIDALVYRSTDGGVSWTQILDGMSTPTDLLVAPNGYIYLSLQSFFASGVTINGVSIALDEWRIDEIRFYVPSNVVTGNLVVTVGGMPSAPLWFVINGTEPGGLMLIPSQITVAVGGSGTVGISGGVPPYTIQTPPNSSIATATLAGSTITVYGVGTGRVHDGKESATRRCFGQLVVQTRWQHGVRRTYAARWEPAFGCRYPENC